MKYYTEHAKTHQRLDRFIHFSSRFVFASVSMVGTYVIQLMIIFQGGSMAHGFAEEWTETGASVFYSPWMLLAPIIATIAALIAPDVYRRVKSKSDSQ